MITSSDVSTELIRETRRQYYFQHNNTQLVEKQVTQQETITEVYTEDKLSRIYTATIE